MVQTVKSQREDRAAESRMMMEATTPMEPWMLLNNSAFVCNKVKVNISKLFAAKPD